MTVRDEPEWLQMDGDGTWLHRPGATDEHACRLPRVTPDVQAGSVWRCCCGRRWRFTGDHRRLLLRGVDWSYSEERGPDDAIWQRLRWWQGRWGRR